MLREQWGFDYTASQLGQAAATKLAFHEECIAWWVDKRKANKHRRPDRP
ncbi:hypothetical protein [Rhodoferax sp.]|nr:hypothetical protein [Rhodoferax sp.]